MDSVTTEELTVLERCWELADRPVADAANQLAPELTRELQGLWPGASLVVCLLPVAGRPRLSVRCPKGMRDESPRLCGGGSLEQTLAGIPLPHGHCLRLERLTTQAGLEVALGVGLPADATEAGGRAQRLLALCCRLLAGPLDREAAMARDRGPAEETQHLADLAVLAGPMTHEFNNFINIVLLQAALLELEVGEMGRQELNKLRQHGRNAAALVQEWHRYRSRLPGILEPLDLHQAIRQVVADWPSPVVDRVRLDLADDVPLVLATRVDLPRLLRFLLGNALAVSSSVTIRTRQAGGAIQLRVEDQGPAVEPGRLYHLFEPTLQRPGTVPLELAACEAIAHRRWQGRIAAENRPEGGLTFTVQLRSALPAAGSP